MNQSCKILPGRSHVISTVMFAVIGAVVAGCSVASLSGSGALSLKPEEGVVGFEFITGTASGGDFRIKLSGFGGEMLKMDDTPRGESIYLFKLPVGRYCIESLYLAGSAHYLVMDGAPPCFKIHAGKLTYGGTISNQLIHFYVADLDAFLRALKSVYPKVYARYVTGPEPVEHPIL